MCVLRGVPECYSGGHIFFLETFFKFFFDYFLDFFLLIFWIFFCDSLFWVGVSRVEVVRCDFFRAGGFWFWEGLVGGFIPGKAGCLHLVNKYSQTGPNFDKL